MCDPFAGTCTVARYFKRRGFKVVTGDLLRLSEVIQRADIAHSALPSFEGLKDLVATPLPVDPMGRAEVVCSHLSSLPGVEGWLTRNFTDAASPPRLFFEAANARAIDAAAARIADWSYVRAIDDHGRDYLTACLLDAADRVANTAGTYYAHLKSLGRKARKPFRMVPRGSIEGPEGNVNRVEAQQLVAETDCDVLYLDPPYNGREYARYYHLLESIAGGREPIANGMSGMPHDDWIAKSRFCSRLSATAALTDLIAAASARHIVVHYATDGFISHEDILSVLNERGPTDHFDIAVRAYSSTAGAGAVAKHRVYWCDVRPVNQ